MSYNEDDVRNAAGRPFGYDRRYGGKPSNGDREFNQRHRNIRSANGRKPSAWLVSMLEFFGW